ncbi:radical SAM protein [Paenibacillus sp. NPDC058177]|uniref:radical SAM protein n=1 Tax=Paenibacillus sp. NPDC058177 TaxID=3346369 RepID=UPI0036DD7EC0
MKGVHFVSKQGTEYYYDDLTGQIFPSEQVDCSLLGDQFQSLASDRANMGLYINRDADQQDIEDYLCKEANGFKQLLLEVTSFCNLRCKYCIYSDHYQFTKSYENKHMTFAVAKQAVDYYFSNFKEIHRRNPTRSPVIGFYGGEPLLNLRLIKEIVEYIKLTYGEYEGIQYNITTNGIQFTEESQNFLTKHDFSIIVSLDGYKENHDRNRLKADGTGSFDEIMKNLQTFRTNHKGYNKFAISSCYDFKTDMFQLMEFFDGEDLFLARLASVDANNTTYYEQFAHDDVQTFFENLTSMKELFLNLTARNQIKKDSFLYSLVGLNYSELAFHPMMNEKRPHMLPVTASCIPGEKIYVTIDGNFHMCEKINTHYAIGNIEDGIDYGKIAEIINNFKNKVCGNCTECNVTRFCNICFQQCATDHEFEKKDSMCDNIETHVKSMLIDFINVLETNPTLFEEITIDYYKTIYEKVGVVLE